MNTHFLKQFLRAKTQVYRNILRLSGLCAACFVFEACYGVPRSSYIHGRSIDVSGTVNEIETHDVVPNAIIQLYIDGEKDTISTFTDIHGNFTFYNILNGSGVYHVAVPGMKVMKTNGLPGTSDDRMMMTKDGQKQYCKTEILVEKN